MLRDGEAHHAAFLLLDDVAVVAQEVDVPQDLRQGEVGLRDRHVAPHRLRQLIGRAGTVGDQPEQLARAALVQPEAISLSFPFFGKIIIFLDYIILNILVFFIPLPF